MTVAFFVACTATFLRLVTLPDPEAVRIMMALAVVPSELMHSRSAPQEALTLLTASFLHGGWLHLIGNMLYLAVFGPPAEDRLGHARFAALYLLAGASGLLVQAYGHAASTTPILGASASIAGVLGAYLVLLPRSKVTTVIPVLVALEVATLPAAFLVGVWFVLQVAGSLETAVTASGTAWLAHVGGFLTGVVIAAALQNRSRNKRRRP